MRGLLIAALKASFTLTYSQAAQSFDIFGCVVAPATRSAAGQGERPEPLPEPKPALAYPKLIGRLADCECAPLLKHAHMLNLTDKCL
jgi:hypothetical protein